MNSVFCAVFKIYFLNWVNKCICDTNFREDVMKSSISVININLSSG